MSMLETSSSTGRSRSMKLAAINRRRVIVSSVSYLAVLAFPDGCTYLTYVSRFSVSMWLPCLTQTQTLGQRHYLWLIVIASKVENIVYRGGRFSPSGSYCAPADVSAPDAPTHLISNLVEPGLIASPCLVADKDPRYGQGLRSNPTRDKTCTHIRRDKALYSPAPDWSWSTYVPSWAHEECLPHSLVLRDRIQPPFALMVQSINYP